MSKRLILCDCFGSQDLNGDAVETACGTPCSKVYSQLCVGQLEAAATEISRGDVIIACQQERQKFLDLADELQAPTPDFLDIRDRAGWSEDTGSKLPKIAALAAEARLDQPLSKSVDIVSEGMCLIIGPSDPAYSVAETLSENLAVTVLATDDADAPVSRRFDTIKGRLRQATGAFGGFELRFDQLRQIVPGGRGPLRFSDPRDGAVSSCDIIVDLSGQVPLFPAPEKREGYLRADPKNLSAMSEVILEASQLIGTFEKPLYVRLEPSLCAHSRAEKVACSNCLNICPTGAITPAGEHVSIDPMVCAGCGECSAVCPSGAITYDAPTVETLYRRINTLASEFRKHTDVAPRLLVHDETHGAEMISLAARFARGLPADVIPLAVENLAGFGHAEILAALASGFVHVDILVSPKTERDALTQELALAQAMTGEAAVELIEPFEPDGLCDTLFATGARTTEITPILPIGTRRQVARLSAKALNPEAEVLPLPETAPYGAVLVDTDACSLCLSCAALCPSGALGENPDKPQLRFQEDACLQCGLCTNICPEDAITLQPQLNLTDTAFNQVVLHEEEPFACIECGVLFGVKSTVEKVVKKLGGTHSVYQSSDTIRLIQMCDNCRINAQYHSENNPFAGNERPRVRTTDDYFSKRKDH